MASMWPHVEREWISPRRDHAELGTFERPSRLNGSVDRR